LLVQIHACQPYPDHVLQETSGRETRSQYDTAQQVRPIYVKAAINTRKILQSVRKNDSFCFENRLIELANDPESIQ